MARLRELGAYARLPIDVVATEGCELVLSDGRRVLDLYGGHCVNSLGGSPPEIEAALVEQWRRVSFVTNLLDHAPRRAFLEAFGRNLPAGEWDVFLSNSGAEANENALKLALAATGRGAVICFAGAFHGRTAAASAVSDLKRPAFPRAPFEVRRVAWGDLEAVRGQLDGEVGAIVLEPIQSMAGVMDPPPGFLAGLRELADESGAALVFDEVQTGSGRTGRPWAAQAFGVTPDMLTTAKGAAAGVPIGITVVAAELAARSPSGMFGSTFGGGPLSLAAAAVVASRVADPEFLANVRAAAVALRAAARHGPVQAVRGAGLLLGLELRPGFSAKEVRDALLERDVLTGTSNDPRVLRLSPPLTLRPADAERLASAFEAAEARA